MQAFITGASGGLGGALVDALLRDTRTERVWATGRRVGGIADRFAHDPRVRALALDVTDPASIQAAADAVRGEQAGLDLVVQAAGLLHDDVSGLGPEKRVEQVSLEGLTQTFAVNTFGPVLIAKALLPALMHGRPAKVVNVSARVGSIDDNRMGGWYSYRASKAAQNQLTRTLAIEVKRRAKEVTVVAYHPGTVDTSLSAPFRRPNKPGVLSADEAAQHLLQVVGSLGPEQTGTFWDWKGEPVPW